MEINAKKEWWGLTFLLVTSIFVYYPSLSYGWFNWDDTAYVLNNPIIQEINFSNLIQNFTTSEIVGTYQPMTNLSFMVDYAIWGRDAQGFHLTNLLLHLSNGILVYLVSRKLNIKVFTSLLLVGIFLLHPMHVESVLWISERKDVLYSLFFLLGVYHYLIDSSKRLLIFFFFLCALLSKVMAITFPLLLFAIDLYKEGRVTRENVIKKVPYIFLSIAFGVIGYMAQKKAGALEFSLQLYDRLLAVVHNIGIYTIKFFYPHDLAIFHPIGSVKTLPIFTLILGLIVLVALVVGLIKLRKQKWYFGLLFFIICLLPVLQIIPFGSAQYAERYTYLAYVGLSISVVASLNAIVKKKAGLNNLELPLIGCAFLVFLIIGSSSRIKEWESNYTIWKGVTDIYPSKHFAYVKLAKLYDNNGDPSTAIETLSNALTKVDYKAEVYAERARIYEKQALFGEAVQDYDAAILNNPFPKIAILNKAKLLARHFDQKKEAARILEVLIDDYPQYEYAYINLGVIKEQEGKLEEALEIYSQGILNTKNNHRLYRYRAVTYWMLGALEKAIEDLNQSIVLKKDFGEAFWIRSNVYLTQGNREAALQDALKAQELNYSMPRQYLQDLYQ